MYRNMIIVGFCIVDLTNPHRLPMNLFISFSIENLNTLNSIKTNENFQQI